MKVHTTEFKEQIKTLGRELDSIISFNGAELGVEELNSVTPYYEGNLLKSVMKQLDIDSNIEIPIGTEINYKFGVKVGDNYEYLDLGNYIVNEVEKQENTNSYIIKCYDKMLYSMVDYEKMNISYPISIKNYINAICEYLGLNFKNKNEEFVNYNKNIPNELYFDEDDKSLGYTFRDVLDELAEVTASTICINDNDELEIRYINDTKDTIDEEFLKNVNVNFGEKYGPINSIVLSRSAGSDNVYLQDENSINENGLTEIKITDNQIMNFNDRSEYLTDILDKLNGIEFYLNDFTSTGITYYDLCDGYNIQIGDNVYNCIMLNDEINITQGLVEEIFTERLNTSETDYSKSDKTDRKINQTNLIVDKQRGIIQGIVEKTDNNSSRITELEIADTNFSVKVSNIEKGIVETNQNVSSLQASVDNVSADFEDFKDNEFINSIGNLQDQIDGAIQFWNGEEIPTINNYPANEWETEEERNNHRADIYTVIEDVDGELKQGKAYRFDKVDNTWQWIELTDNELSAVQAIAQEALEKSNKNIGDIQELVKKTSELSVKDEEITASVEEINNKYEQDITLTKEANGNPITIEDAGPYKLESLKIDGKSYQETTNGYQLIDFSKPSSISGNTSSSFENDVLSITSTAGSYRRVVWNILDLYKNNVGKTLYFNFDSADFSKGKLPIIQLVITKSSGASYVPIVATNQTKTPYTIPEDVSDITGVLVAIYSNNTATVGEYSITITKPTLSFVENAPYEKYTGGIASPSPDFPSEIKNVKGVTNSFDLEKYPFTSKVAYNNVGEQVWWGGYCGILDYYPVEENTTYYYSNSTGKPIAYGLVFYDKDKNILSSIIASIRTFTTPENCKYIRFAMNTSDLPTWVQIEYGDKQHKNVPCGRWLEVKSIGKNLCNGINQNYYLNTAFNTCGFATGNSGLVIPTNGATKMTISTQIAQTRFRVACINELPTEGVGVPAYNGANRDGLNRVLTIDTTNYKYLIVNATDLTKIQVEEGSTNTEIEDYKETTALIDLNKKNLFNKDTIITGYRLGSDGLPFAASDYFLSDFIDVESSSQYIYLKKPNNTTDYVCLYDKDKNFISRVWFADALTYRIINTTDVTKYIRYTDTIEHLDITKIYKGVEIDDYYRLASISDVADTFKDGALTQRIGKVVLDGSEGWFFDTTKEKTQVFGMGQKLPMSGYQITSSHFVYNASGDAEKIVSNGSNIYIAINKTTASTTEEFKNWLKEQYDAGTPVIIEYQLATPIEHTLNYEVLELHEGYNNITTNDDLEPNMEIRYLTNSKLNAKYATKGELKVTANNITSEINSTLKNGYTTIEQTNKIEQKITDTENEILIEVGKKVDEEDFTGANILLAINGDESEVQINADKINLNGVVTANENFIISEDGSMKAKAGAFGAWNIDDDGNIYADRKVGNKIYRTYIQQANTADGGETWAFSTQVSEDDGQTFYYTSFITNDGELYAEKDIISTEGTVAGQHLTALDLTYNPEFIIPIYGETIQGGTVSLPTSQSTAVAAITIDPGKYLVVSQFQFSTNADGQRAVNVSTSSGATSIDITQQAPSGLQTRIRHVGYLTPTKQTTYYWNMYQTSGATLSGNVWIQLFRLQ